MQEKIDQEEKKTEETMEEPKPDAPETKGKETVEEIEAASTLAAETKETVEETKAAEVIAETTFANPTVDEIQQIQGEPKTVLEKKVD